MRISQSLIKDWGSHVKEELCGSIFEAKYITNTWDRTWQDSDAKALGRYFEYKLTGELPTGYKEAPQAIYMKSAKAEDIENENVSKMMAEYRRANANAERIKTLLKDSGFTIKSAQIYLTEGELEGTIDIISQYKPKGAKKAQEVNLDVKYSGLLFDKWNKFGWMWTDEQKEYNAIQTTHYTLLTGNPTWFLVVSSTNEVDVKLFGCDVSEEYKESHKDRVRHIIEQVNVIKNIGFANYPELKKCGECPLKDKCKDAITTLIPEVINI